MILYPLILHNVDQYRAVQETANKVTFSGIACKLMVANMMLTKHKARKEHEGEGSNLLEDGVMESEEEKREREEKERKDKKRLVARQLRAKRSKEMFEKERASVPWSVFLITLLNLLTVLPWLPQSLFPNLFLGCHQGGVAMVVDLSWTIVITAASTAPLALIVTDNNLNEALKEFWNNMVASIRRIRE
eukprot:sb/3471220/